MTYNKKEYYCAAIITGILKFVRGEALNEGWTAALQMYW